MTDFSRMIEAEIPRLRRYARSLSRYDEHTADDLRIDLKHGVLLVLHTIVHREVALEDLKHLR